MLEQATELRRIHWQECFSFTRLLDAFKLAIHPSKLVLAVAGLLVTALWGGCLDLCWPDVYRPIGDEVNAFWQVSDLDAWRAESQAAQGALLSDAYRRLTQLGYSPPADLDKQIEQRPDAMIAKALVEVQDLYEAAVRKLSGIEDEVQRCRQVAERAQAYRALYADLAAMKPRGIFRSLVSYEHTVLLQLADAARSLNFTGQLQEVLAARSRWGEEGDVRSPEGHSRMLIHPRTGTDGIGVLPSLLLMVRGVQWLVTRHVVYAVLLLGGMLAIWALAGGAICRMAALNVARDERIPIKDALVFARRKWIGLVGAPLMPVGMVAAVGICLFVGGLVCSVPYLGELVGGLLLFLSLTGGVVIALVVVGAIGGGSLMWPAIAVEGSDAFDAMSRSYSYAYSRPWRTAFYSAVLVVYGAIVYLLARFFVLLSLKFARWFLSAGAFATERPGTGRPFATKIHAMWANPTPEDLMPSVMPIGQQGWEAGGAMLVQLWVFLLVLTAAGLLVSFCFSGATIMYFLLRRKVDATDIEEVFVEEDGEEESTVSPATVTAGAGGTGPAAVEAPRAGGSEAARPAPPASPASPASPAWPERPETPPSAERSEPAGPTGPAA